MRIITIITLLTIVTLIAGCGPARPKDMPKTAPCVITVLQDGKPMQDAVITLYYAEGSGSLNIDGTTDESGKAEIRTTWGSYTTKGAPVGTCKVTVNKHFDIPPDSATWEESMTWTPAQAEKYEKDRAELVAKMRIVPVEIASVERTPLTVTIESGAGGTLTVEINDYKK
jgi:hypothetical protein